MLGSWLRPKPTHDDEGSGTDEWEEEKPTHRPKYRSLITDPAAPHNAVLAEVHGLLPNADGSIALPKEQHTTPSTKPETLLDPVTGQLLGVLNPPELHDETPVLSSLAAENEELWSHLSAVLDLQAQIAKKHLAMEAPRGGVDRKKRQSSKPGLTSWDEKRRMFKAANNPTSTKSIDMLSAVSEPDDPSVKVEGEEDVEARSREEEFTSLADHLEGRKEAIDDIMGQLDRLSVALTKQDLPGLRQSSNPISAKSHSKDSAPGTTSTGSTTFSLPKALPESQRRHPYPLVLNDMVSQAAPIESPTSTVTSLVPAD
ncbi:hypothetical protein DL96DRAFT_1574469 [Flagelloscypha sp. PMI_526]|nr:hypothetical protein DL96DRAFT_1574469 [Flagelloscypha sp. PMI_526]